MKNFVHLTPDEWVRMKEYLHDWIPIHIGRGSHRRVIAYFPPMLGM